MNSESFSGNNPTEKEGHLDSRTGVKDSLTSPPSEQSQFVSHSACFLKATCPDIPLDMLCNSDTESSSSDASSVLDETALKLMVAEKISYDQLVFNRKVLPDGFSLGTLAPSAPKQSMMVIRVDASLLHNPSSEETRKACVGVRSRGGPKPTSECCVSLTWMVMQGEYTGIYPGSGKRRPYV
jgi:hypothetical protein